MGKELFLSPSIPFVLNKGFSHINKIIGFKVSVILILSYICLRCNYFSFLITGNGKCYNVVPSEYSAILRMFRMVPVCIFAL